MTDLHTAIRGALPANSGSGDIMWEDWTDGIIAAIAPLVVDKATLEHVGWYSDERHTHHGTTTFETISCFAFDEEEPIGVPVYRIRHKEQP